MVGVRRGIVVPLVTLITDRKAVTSVGVSPATVSAARIPDQGLGESDGIRGTVGDIAQPVGLLVREDTDRIRKVWGVVILHFADRRADAGTVIVDVTGLLPREWVGWAEEPRDDGPERCAVMVTAAAHQG